MCQGEDGAEWGAVAWGRVGGAGWGGPRQVGVERRPIQTIKKDKRQANVFQKQWRRVGDCISERIV